MTGSLGRQIVYLLSVLALLSSCDKRPASGLKGQTNTTMTFYGLVVDELGAPLRGVDVEYEVEAYPKDWTFETRGRPYDVSKVKATSDERGRFDILVTGCRLRKTDVVRNGYRPVVQVGS
jgi:hypothetical protein